MRPQAIPGAPDNDETTDSGDDGRRTCLDGVGQLQRGVNRNGVDVSLESLDGVAHPGQIFAQRIFLKKRAKKKRTARGGGGGDMLQYAGLCTGSD